MIDQQPDGSVKIRLEIAMRERGETAVVTPSGKAPVDRPPTVTQSSMKLLGLLCYLWDEAGLNRWKPAYAGKRKASLAYWLLHNAADDLLAGRVKLIELLLPAFGRDPQG